MSSAFRSRVLGVLVLFLGSANARAQTVKLNGPLARTIGSDVRSVQIDELGKRVVYIADQEHVGVPELFSAKPGAAPIRLNLPLVPGEILGVYQLAPDGSTVVYSTGFPDHGVFSVPAGGGQVVRLDGAIQESIQSLQIDPASRRVVYLAQVEALGGAYRQELFSAPLDGSALAVQLSRNGTDRVYRHEIAGDRVLYQVVRSGRETAVMSAPVDGSLEPVEIIPFRAGTAVPYEVSAEGGRVLYKDPELVSVSADGRGSPSRLTDVSIGDFAISPDGRRAVYSRSGTFATQGIYSVSILGDEAPIRLDIRGGSQFQIEGLQVLFKNFQGRLCSVPLLGGAPPLQISGQGSVVEFRLAERRVLFVEDADPRTPERELRSAVIGSPEPSVSLVPAGLFADHVVAGENVLFRGGSALDLQLFSVPIDGSRLPVRVSDKPIAGRGVKPGFAASGDGKRVAYIADSKKDEVFDLFLAPTDGRFPPLQLNPPFPLGLVEGDVNLARFTADGSRAIFLADAREDEVFELFSVSSAGDEPPLQLNPPLVPGGDVVRFELTPDRVVYLADQDVDGAQHLYSVPVGGGPSVRIDGVVPSVPSFQLTPDGSRAVFSADAGLDGRYELYSVPVDGSALSMQLASGLDPFDVISPSTDRVVFTADPDGDAAHDLFSVPVAGGAAVRLNDPVPQGSFFRESRITSDRRRVLYQLQSFPPTSLRLFSVPIDRSSGPIELSAAMPASAQVTSFALGPDGTRVVFSADALVAGVHELFSMPVDGSAAPLRLRTASAGRMEVTPDGTRVVYLVPGTPGVFELHVVPLDASSPPIVLSSPRQFDGPNPIDLHTWFQITPDSTHVVFRAKGGNGNFLISVVPLDGSRAPRVLSRPFPDHELARDDFRLTPDGKTLIYRIGLAGTQNFGSALFEIPLSGPRLPMQIGPRTAEYTTTYRFELSPDGQRVMHRTDLDTPGVVELYASRRTDGPRLQRR